MNADLVIDRLFEALTSGDRPAARAIVNEQHKQGADPEMLITELYWPTYQLLDRMHREDQLSAAAFGFGTRLLRQIVDQTASALLRWAKPQSNGRSVLAFTAQTEQADLGCQMAVDLLEASGFSVRFAGSGVANDEIQAMVQNDQPDVLLMFCSDPQNLPDIRALIDNLHEVGACPGTQIAVGGGVFNRAEGLAEEIGADLWAQDPFEMVDRLTRETTRRATPEQRTVGKQRPAVRAA